MNAAIDHETEYDNRARVPEHGDIMASWAEEAAGWRAEAPDVRTDVAYGPSPRQRLDVFGPRLERPGPIALFIHGGYWQALGRESFSHMARGANEHGLAVAVASYDLCPEVSVSDVVHGMRACCIFLWKTFGRRIAVAGHSAGGHLTAALLATSWRDVDPDAPPLLVVGGLSISGLFDLRPLVGTSVNDKLRMTEETAGAASPLFWTPPSGLRMIAAVGGEESREFKRQTRTVARVWGRAGVAVTPLVLSGENHFTIIAGLADADHLLSRALVGLASAAG